MESAALREAIARGRPAFPLLVVDWVARGLDLGRDVCAPTVRPTAAGQVTRTTKPGGWGPIEYGSGIEAAAVRPVATTVDVADADGALLRMLDVYDPRGSAASIYAAAAGLATADFETLFVGIVEDFEANDPFTRLHLKTDDTVLRTPVPLAVFDRPTWGAADDSTIYGVRLPLIFGIHDAFKVTARGMVPTVNVRYDEDLGYWFLVSVGNMVDVRRLYYDGVPITTGKGSWWDVRREVLGGSLVTVVTIAEGYQPEEGTVVAVDVEGPDAAGLADGDALTNPVDQLRAVLEEYVYRPAPLGAWRGDHAIVDGTSWDAAAAYFAARGYESARRFGADQGETSAAEVVQSFLDAYPWTRIDWTPTGTLALTVIDADDADPTDDGWIDLKAHNEGPRVPFTRGDRREVYSQVAQPFMYSSQEQKYLASYEAHDPAAVEGEAVALTIENPWSQGRFSEDD